jgi:membrane protein implicated in regulation of membrane protease activity
VRDLLRSASAAARPTSSGSVGLGIVGIVLWVVAVRRADFLGMGPLGLVTVLPWAYFVGLAALVVGFVVELLRTPLRSNRLIFLVLGLIVMMFGTASAVEPVARLEDSYLLAGFVEYIFQHGHVLLNYDARFSWPGAFSLGAVLVAFAGKTNALDFIRWFPLIIEILYLPPLLVIAKCSDVGRRAGWLGVALFYASNWIDQDYFSPQALNFLFYLVVVATVLACWKPARRRLRERAPGGFRGRITALRGRIADSRSSLTRVRLAGRDATACSGSWSLRPPSATNSPPTQSLWRWAYA